jgi:radical SAM protein with 4Fe4S-binding SPASM domain
LRSFSRETGHLKADFFRENIDALADKLIYLIFYFQGEPYINPKFLDMVGYANRKGLYTITSTNGHFLTDETCQKTITSGLDRIIISIDGTTQESYEAYRKKGNLNQVIDGTKRLVHWKKKLKSSTPHIIFQFLVVKPNEHEIPDIIKLAKKIGVDELKFKTAQIYDYEFGNELIPTIDRFSRYKKQENGSYKIKNHNLNHCWKLWHSAVITWNGMVVPCCFDKDAEYRLGDLKKDAFKRIWNGQAYNNFRKSLIKGRKEIKICKNCTEGCQVWV